MSRPYSKGRGRGSSSPRFLPAVGTSSGAFVRSLVPLLLLAGTGLHADPLAPGFTLGVYAQVTDPIRLAFAADGVLYAGRDNTGSGGNNEDAVRIHRIGAGGAPVEEYGSVSIPDPDALFVDRDGVFGPAGSVLVGGVQSFSNGQISLVSPAQTVSLLVAPTPLFWNPTGFARDASGRVLFTNTDSRPSPSPLGVFTLEAPGNPPSLLFTTPLNPVSIAVDHLDRILVSTVDGRIRLYDSSGTLLDDQFVTGLGTNYAAPLAFGPLGASGATLVSATSAGDLLCISPDGQTRVIGTGFSPVTDLALDGQGALYISQFSQDRILRLVPDEPVIQVVDLPGAGFELHFGGILQSSPEPSAGPWTDLDPQPQSPLVISSTSPDSRLFWRTRPVAGCGGE